jgi:radical SAM superfamily enzyme YgiQ (UPF0313 family)
MKILFIESTRYRSDGQLLRAKRLFYPSITLPYLAALTPKDIEVRMTHEMLEDVDFEADVDLVAVTSITNNVLRAYEISGKFRKRGVPVAIGGFHASAEPEEAAEYADFVFIGEAEETWPQFLEDFRRGEAKTFYKPVQAPSLEGIPFPDYSLIDKAHYVGYRRKALYRKILQPLIPVQTARGCPVGCDFCDVTHFHNGTYRTRPVADVVGEIQTQKARFICFVDDNIFADVARAKELFKALVPLKIVWIGQGTIHAAEDEELVHLACKSGCRGLLVGLETISQEGLESVGKAINDVGRYERNLRTYRKAGIDIDASIVFGFDNEDPSAFDSTFRFLMKSRVPFAGLQPLRPSPATPLYERLKAEGRLKKEKWWLDRESVADIFDLKYTGTRIGENNFADNLYKLYRRFYSVPNIIRRFLLPPRRRFVLHTVMTLMLRRKISRQAFVSEY